MKPANVVSFGRRSVGVVAVLFCVLLAGCKQLGGGGGGGKNQTPPATGLTATAGNAQVTLSWNAYPGALGYGLVRSTTSGSGNTGHYLNNAIPIGTTANT